MRLDEDHPREAVLASRPRNGEDLENQRLKAKLGEVMIERDLLPRDLSSNKKHLRDYGKNRSHR